MPSSPEVRKQRLKHKAEVAKLVINQYKLKQGCVDCGYREHAIALQFDHIDPSTKLPELGWIKGGAVGKMTSRPRFEAYFAHVQKYCAVRCANCHAVRTHAEWHYVKNSQ